MIAFSKIYPIFVNKVSKTEKKYDFIVLVLFIISTFTPLKIILNKNIESKCRQADLNRSGFIQRRRPVNVMLAGRYF